MVKNLPAMWETLVRSLGWEDLLEKVSIFILVVIVVEKEGEC